MSDEKQNDVAIILINYNSSNYSIDCIESIISNTNNKLNYQIIVIDNASGTKDYKNLKNKLASFDKNIFLFRSRINLGFSGGNMLGVQFSNARYYFFLNNDCILIHTL